MKDKLKQLGAELTALREKNKITKYKVYKGAKMSPTIVKAIESGELNYTIESLLKYMEQSKIKFSDLKFNP